MHVLLRRLTERHRPAVLLVTHDVDEAIELADRVIVLEGGRLLADVPIELPGRSDGKSAAGHAALRRRLLALLGVEEVLAG